MDKEKKITPIIEDTIGGEISPKKDIFDKIMSLPVLNILEGFYKKNKSVLLYLFFGALTTLLSIIVFYIFGTTLDLNEHIANVISWICAVTFAFVTNRIWVFNAPTKTMKDLLLQGRNFYGGRLLTLGIEEVILLLFITILGFNKNLVKIVAQFVILVLNYFISKLFVFRKKLNQNK
ncbi:MAG: GtrA family protein [Clostridiales bacterium]|nr:GtrA family protein [Clostridiales bacterium]